MVALGRHIATARSTPTAKIVALVEVDAIALLLLYDLQ
jgi:hypothetical protein